MSLHEGNPNYRTALGSCISILVLVVTLLFMSQNIVILTERKGTQFTSSVLQQFHDDTYEFDSENGFALAFGMLY